MSNESQSPPDPAPVHQGRPPEAEKRPDCIINQTKFLAAIRESGSVTEAARWAGITKSSHFKWMKRDEEYVGKFREAMAESVQLLEDEARRRAVRGTRRQIRYKGKVVGEELEYSDALLMLLLRANNPDKFKDRAAVDMNISSADELKQRLAAGRLRAAEVRKQADLDAGGEAGEPERST